MAKVPVRGHAGYWIEGVATDTVKGGGSAFLSLEGDRWQPAHNDILLRAGGQIVYLSTGDDELSWTIC